jgi:hypothetical protein
VEDAQDANLRAEMSRVGRDLAECRRARLKEPRVHADAVPIGQGQQAMRQREDDVHVRHVEQIAFAGAEPAVVSPLIRCRSFNFDTLTDIQ